MSTTIAFDTHAYVKKLRDAGVDEHQAEIQAEAILALVEERLATKQDMHALKRDLADVEANLRKDMASIESNLKRDIKELDTKTETRLKELELRMVIKMGAMILGGIGLVFGLMRAWPLPVQYVPYPGTQEKNIPAAPAPPVTVSPIPASPATPAPSAPAPVPAPR
ncbi:MAG: hypothetical protein HQL77_11905 [Magnetococcales bacterium]|nr:hypothetical protein [Magnetococcales bacterium]